MNPRPWVQVPHGISFYESFLTFFFKNLKRIIENYYKGKTLSGSVPEPGQRGET